MPSPRNLTLACVLRPPSSHSWPTNPPDWEFQSHNGAHCLPTRRNTVAQWGCPETPNEDQPACHSTAPQLYRLLWALMLCLPQPEPRPPDRQPDSWPHTQHLGPTMALGRPLFPTLVFRLQNIDLFSNHCTGANLMQKSELLPPHGKKPYCWHGVQPSG